MTSHRPTPDRSRRLRFIAWALLSWAPVTSGLADDTVVLLAGERVRGTIVSLSPDAVELETRGQKIRRFNIVELREIAFDGEPDALGDARGLLRKREARAALKELAKVEAADIQAAEPRVRDEFTYLKLVAAARAAAAADAPAAAAALKTFMANNLRSHHFYEGQEALGDLLGKLGKFDEAANAYGELDRGPPALRVRGAASKARLLLQRGKAPEALKEFEAATRIPTEPGDASGEVEKNKAELGMVRCLARMGKAKEGITAARTTIRKVDPKNRELLALAFAALGQCQRTAGGKEEDALISFLMVDLVYNGVPEAHAEALYNLVELWESSKQPERGREARQALLTNYPQSSWAKKLGGGKAS